MAAASSNKEAWVGGDDVGAIVIDLGTQRVQMGYAGEDSPKQFWSSYTGVHCEASESTDESMTDAPPPPSTDSKQQHKTKDRIFPLDFNVLRRNVEVRPTLQIAEGQVTLDCDGFEAVISACCGSRIGLGVNLQGKPVLLTEPSRHCRTYREKLCEIMFERFKTEAIYIAKRAGLNAFSSGRQSACVVEIGASNLTLTPVQDGYTLQKNCAEYPVGGNFLDDALANIIGNSAMTLNSGPSSNTQLGTNSNRREIVPLFAYKKIMKDLSKGIEQITRQDLSGVHLTYLEHGKREVLRNIKESVCRVSEDGQDIDNQMSYPSGRATSTSRYELPDGTTIETDAFEQRVPELLFYPHSFQDVLPTTNLNKFIGLPQAIHACIEDCDVDIKRDLLGSIILTGGTSLLPGLPERVQRVLQEDNDLFGSAVKFRLVSHSASTERRFSSWIGGSILASLGSFQQLWFSRAEYEEHGPSLCERRCAQ